MTDTFVAALKHTLGIEGDYADDAADSGGKTRWGITEAVARAFGYAGDMRDLPLNVAKTIYHENYWTLLHLEQVATLSDDVALELFDTAVNCGTGFAGRSLQRALNVFNQGGTRYPDLVVDGLIGRMTIASLRGYLDYRGAEGELVLLRTLNSLQGCRYVEIAETREKDERFIYGWMLRRVE